jgi:chromate transporter
MNQLPQLAFVFAYLSLLTVGGGMAAFPELRHMTVEVHHWLTAKQLVHLYTIGQLAPGPNMMVVAPIGMRVEGLTGAFVTVFAFFFPTCWLAYGVAVAWDKLAGWPWRASIQRGLAPVSIGLLFAGCMSLAMDALSGWLNVVLAMIVFAILLRYKVNPALLVMICAVLGFFIFRGAS